MKRTKKAVACILLIVMALALAMTALSAPPSGSEISIIFTHDMHAHFDPERYVTGGSIAERGGYARMKTAMDGVFAGYPDTFVLDAGDFSMGTLYQTIFSEEAPDLRMLGLLGYDAVTLGNHEYDYRTQGLTDMLRAAMASGDSVPPITVSNIDWQRTMDDGDRAAKAGDLRRAMQEYGIADYLIIEKGGVKAAIFGIMGKESDSYAPESGIYFLDPIESSKDIVARIKSETDADIIICLSHSGTKSDPKKSEDELLAAAVPEIDVIISGHTHTRLEQPIVVGNTLIVSCGEHGYNIGHLTLTRDGERYKVTGYALIPVSQDLQKDSAIENAIMEFRTLVDMNYLSGFGYSFDQVLANSDFGFTPIEDFGRVQREDTLGNLISDSYVAAVRNAEGANYRNVDIAVVPSGVVRGSFTAGDISVANAFVVSSLGIGPDRVPGYPLVSIYLTGKELKTVSEIDISVSTLMGEARLYISGLTYTYNPHRLILNRVTDTRLVNQDGSTSKIEDDKLYRVIGGLYSCQMLGAVESKSFGLLKVTPKDMYGDPITNFEDFIVYDTDGRELKEWVALAQYLESFDKVNGVSKMPEYYNQLHGRKVEAASWSPIQLLKSPNKIFFIVVGAVILVLAILIVPTVLIIRKVRRKRRAKREDAGTADSNTDEPADENE